MRRMVAEMEPDATFPSEAALQTEHGVARTTVRRALAVLEREGLIVSHPGRGRKVAGSGAGNSGAPAETLPQKIARKIAESIQQQEGDYAPGRSLPSETKLAEKYGVSRGSVRHALGMLEDRGLIERVPGKPRRVVDTP